MTLSRGDFEEGLKSLGTKLWSKEKLFFKYTEGELPEFSKEYLQNLIENRLVLPVNISH
jgi:hypothetical protein